MNVNAFFSRAMIILLFFSTSCVGCGGQTRSENKHQALKQVSTLTTLEGDTIGQVFVNHLKSDSTVFTNLYVISNHHDTIYVIDKTIFKNQLGIDITVLEDNFYGYKFILIKKDYLVISCMGKQGEVSDDITIMWDENEKILKVEKI